MNATTAITKRLLFLTGILKKMNYNQNDIKSVRKAYDFALRKHGNQLRKSGEPYIIHPIETSIYLAEWKMDIPTVITGLLHDVLEDTDCTEEEIEKRFGSHVLEMVKTVTKVSKISDDSRAKEVYDETNSEYIIKVIMSISKDLRPIMVKIADRMHNMTTISYLKKEKQIRIARETFNIYASIAGRLGLYQQKVTLLDLSFSVLEPNKYLETKEIINNIVLQSRNNFNYIKSHIEEILKKNKINCKILERTKGVYSTYKKIEKGMEPKDIHDIFAIRIIGDFSEIKCYEILGLIHLNFTFLPRTFKDYISSPKLNLYQSLHTTISYRKAFIEIQIRNNSMDNMANYGIAAHWIYKENEENDGKKITFELMHDIFDPKEIESLKRLKNIQQIKIYDVLLLNNNKWYVVTENSTVLDLAYRYNPEKILYLKNTFKEGAIVPLSYAPIKDDIITLNYSDSIVAKPEWANFATIESLKNLLLDLQSNNENDETKYITLLREKLGSNLVDAKEIKKRLGFLNFASISKYFEYFDNIKDIDKNIVFGFLSKNKKWKKYYIQLVEIKEKFTLFSYNIKNIQGINYKKVKFPDCCSKVPGIQILGLLEKKILYVHNMNCTKVDKAKKMFILEWDNERIDEFPKFYYCSLSITYNTTLVKIIPIIHFITSKGIEMTYLLTSKINSHTKITDFKLKVNNYNVIKKLIDDLNFKFDQIEITVK
ncbi:MAG: bifunctional (p)ppGpp synthetase/guanosine-3',5'-bis(diphosphate) 3'-pyrophosphohydrolase [Mycoplasma sp.]|nr:bifunctional (p)ppGpp synthetase/guanosine-3',5'-bis(diphosphate) 3'-pyrophosphohydrolase [Mycoplasma sp.]